MNIEKLPVLWQDAIHALKGLHNAPEEISIPCVLGVANFAVQSLYDVDPVLYHRRPISIFVMALAKTAALKSTIYKELDKGIRDFEELERTRLVPDQERYDLEWAIYEKEKKQFISSSVSNFGKGTHSTADAMPVRPRPVETCKLRISKTTVNGIVDNLKTQSQVGLFSSEAGEFFSGHAFQGQRSDTTRSSEMVTALTNMWDAQPLDKNTSEDKTTLHNRRVNMLFLLQETMVRKFLSTAQFSDQGFIHRLLISQAPDFEIPDFDYSEQARQVREQFQSVLQAFHERILRLLQQPRRYRSYADIELPFELDPAVMSMTQPALNLLEQFSNTQKHTRHTTLRDYEGFASRINEHTLRLAATVAAFEFKSRIDHHDMAAAIELMQFFIAQRQQLTIDFDAARPEQRTIVEKLVEWMRETGFDGTRKEFMDRAKFGVRHMDVKQVDTILIDMQLTGEVERYDTVARNNRKITRYRTVSAPQTTPSAPHSATSQRHKQTPPPQQLVKLF